MYINEWLLIFCFKNIFEFFLTSFASGRLRVNCYIFIRAILRNVNEKVWNVSQVETNNDAILHSVSRNSTFHKERDGGNQQFSHETHLNKNNGNPKCEIKKNPYNFYFTSIINAAKIRGCRLGLDYIVYFIFQYCFQVKRGIFSLIIWFIFFTTVWDISQCYCTLLWAVYFVIIFIISVQQIRIFVNINARLCYLQMI